MTKALRNISEPKREEVARTRANLSTKGNGYWAAIDYLERKRNNKLRKEASK